MIFKTKGMPGLFQLVFIQAFSVVLGNKRERLINALKFKSSRSLPPIRFDNETLMVYMGFEFTDIQMVLLDDSLRVTGWLKQSWKDEYLTWRPEMYGGLTEIDMPARSIWYPDTAVLHESSESSLLEPNVVHMTVFEAEMISEASIMIPLAFHERCSMQSSVYPFDSRSCTAQIGSWSSDAAVLKYRISNNSSMESNTRIESNTRSLSWNLELYSFEWNLISHTASTKEMFMADQNYKKSVILITTCIERNHKNFLIMNLAPMVTLAICNCLVAFAARLQLGRKSIYLPILPTVSSILVYLAAVRGTKCSSESAFGSVLGYYITCLILTNYAAAAIAAMIPRRTRSVVIPAPESTAKDGDDDDVGLWMSHA